MKYIIIGLGNYGGVLAEELSVLGHEVIGVDTNEHRVDVLKDKIATSFIIDATDEQSLSVGYVPFRHLVIAFFRQFFAGWIGEGHGGVGVKRFDGLLGRLVVPCGCRQIGHRHQNAQQHDENRQVDHESPPARPRLMLRLRTRGR